MNDVIVKDEVVIENLIYEIRGVQVMLDSDLAKLYEVETKQLNRQVKRNIERFDEDFMFQLTDLESLLAFLQHVLLQRHHTLQQQPKLS